MQQRSEPAEKRKRWLWFLLGAMLSVVLAFALFCFTVTGEFVVIVGDTVFPSAFLYVDVVLLVAGAVFLVLSFRSRRSKSQRTERMPGWSAVFPAICGAATAAVLLFAILPIFAIASVIVDGDEIVEMSEPDEAGERTFALMNGFLDEQWVQVYKVPAYSVIAYCVDVIHPNEREWRWWSSSYVRS